jgi:uncharacterized membrane protein
LHILLFVVIVVAGTGGELCVSRAMKQSGGLSDGVSGFRPRAIYRTIITGLRSAWMWLGVAMMASAFFALLAALSIYNVSFVVPVTALSYVVGSFGSATFLRERVSLHRWLGILLVAAGVTLVILGKD